MSAGPPFWWAARAGGRCTTPPMPDGWYAEVWPIAEEWAWLVLDRTGRTVAEGMERSKDAAKIAADAALHAPRRR